MFFSRLCDSCSFSKGWRDLQAHLIDDTVSDTIALCFSHKYKMYKIIHNYSFMIVHEFNTLKGNTFMQNLHYFLFPYTIQYKCPAQHIGKILFFTNFWPDFGIDVMG